MIKTEDYITAHRLVKSTRGSATDQVCVSCGGQAREWAYQYPDQPAEDGLQYSSDPSDYEPMCTRCHNKFDMEHDPSLLERYRQNGKRSGEILAAKVKSDPEFAADILARMERGRTSLFERQRTDPEWARANHSAAGKLGGRAAISQRRKCAQCGMVAAPPHLGGHQKASGHEGWTTL